MSDFDIIHKLDQLYLEKKKANPRHSLRAFAKYLDLSPSMLSRLMSKKIHFTEKMFRKILPKLSLSFSEQKNYLEKYLKTKNDPASNGHYFFPEDVESFYRDLFSLFLHLKSEGKDLLRVEDMALIMKIAPSEALFLLDAMEKAKAMIKIKSDQYQLMIEKCELDLVLGLSQLLFNDRFFDLISTFGKANKE